MENNNAHSASLVLADYIEPSHHPTAAMTNNRRPDEDSGAETVYDEDNADNYGNRKNDSTCSDLTIHRTKSNRDRRKQQDPESSNGIYFSSASLDSKSIVDGASIESTEAYMCDDDGSQDRVTVNLERSSLQKFLFALTPEVFAYKSDTYCMVSLKIHPAFCKENVMLRISNDGWRASVTFTMPKTYMDPRNILGVAIDQEHVLYQAVKDEIFRFQKQFENRPKAFLHLNLPFAAEPKTADDIFGKGSGQTANLIPLTKGKNIRPDHFAGNVVFFFKKRGNSFHVSTRSSAHLHDARRSFKSASTTNNGLGENGDDSYMSHPDLSGVKRKKK